MRPGKLHGICFSIGRNPPPEIARRALEMIAQDTHRIRTYSPEPYYQQALDIGLDVVPTTWLGSDPSVNERCYDALIHACKQFSPAVAIVGNETLMQNALTPEQLVGYVRTVRAEIPKSTLITIAEDARDLLRAPSVMEPCDVVGMHYYPFWVGVHIDQALANFVAKYEEVKGLANGKPIMVFETGWPSDGGCVGQAVASIENANRYFREIMTWSAKAGVSIFWFAAFNEYWKRKYEGAPGPHWGLRPCPKSGRKYWLHA